MIKPCASFRGLAIVASLEARIGLCNDVSSEKVRTSFSTAAVCQYPEHTKLWFKWEVAPYLALLAISVAQIHLRADCGPCGRNHLLVLRHLPHRKIGASIVITKGMLKDVRIWYGEMKVRLNCDMSQSGTVLEAK
jgi:hypothetical protein